MIFKFPMPKPIWDQLSEQCSEGIIKNCKMSELEERFTNLLWANFLPWWYIECTRRTSGSLNGYLDLLFWRTPNWISDQKFGFSHVFPEEDLGKRDLESWAKRVTAMYVMHDEIMLLENRKLNIDYLTDRINTTLAGENDER